MNYFDVFNGDADGICALIQLRQDTAHEGQLITGVKRDIRLLKRITPQSGDNLTVLDISFEKNVDDVVRLLDAGAHIDYIDHHKTGDLIKHENLTTTINLSPDVCTSLLVNQRLNGKYKEWALTAAFGDNLSRMAFELGIDYGISRNDLEQLSELGILINYNGYGETTDDLHFHPADLYKKLCTYATPFEFLADDMTTFETLKQGYESDMDDARHADIIYSSSTGKIVELPNQKWAKRVSGVYGNTLANERPELAHAVIQKRSDNESYLISIRAPLNKKDGADTLASQFPTGGGRKAAAGINALPLSMLDEFIKKFESVFS